MTGIKAGMQHHDRQLFLSCENGRRGGKVLFGKGREQSQKIHEVLFYYRGWRSWFWADPHPRFYPLAEASKALSNWVTYGKLEDEA